MGLNVAYVVNAGARCRSHEADVKEVQLFLDVYGLLPVHHSPDTRLAREGVVWLGKRGNQSGL